MADSCVCESPDVNDWDHSHTHIYIYMYAYDIEMVEQFDTKSSIKFVGFWSLLEVSRISSHIEKLRYNKTVCLWMTIYTFPSLGLTILVKELPTAISVMQSSSNLVSNSTKRKQTKAIQMHYNSWADVHGWNDWVVRFQVKCKVRWVSIPAWSVLHV